jgi:hypothetical protein
MSGVRLPGSGAAISSVRARGPLFTAIEVSRWDHQTLTGLNGFDPLLYSFAGLKVARNKHERCD